MNPRIHNRQAFARVSLTRIASGVATIEVQPADFNYGYHPVGKYSNIPLDHLLYKDMKNGFGPVCQPEWAAPVRMVNRDA